MKHDGQQTIFADIEQLANRSSASLQETHSVAARILAVLFGADGYKLESFLYPNAAGFDFLAKRAADTRFAKHSVGIKFKHHRKPLGPQYVRESIGAAFDCDLDRAILVASEGFTEKARQTVNQVLPVSVELLDLTELREWAHRVVAEATQPEDVSIAVRTLSKTLATLVARSPEALDEIEWRDLERLLAEAFTGLGFNVTLTPPAKDGGKDIILECLVANSLHTYVVEVKHWRAGGRVGSTVVTNFLKSLRANVGREVFSCRPQVTLKPRSPSYPRSSDMRSDSASVLKS